MGGLLLVPRCGRASSRVMHSMNGHRRSDSPIAHPHRVAVAALIGLGVLVAGFAMQGASGGAGDFGYAWSAARYLLAGMDPYASMDPTAPYGRGGPFLYPLPAAVVAAPIAALPPGVAALVFVAIGIGLFAYAMTARGWWGLVALVSAPAVMTVLSVNWGFLMVAAAMLPGLAWLSAAKPNLGLVALAYHGRARVLIVCLVFCLATLLLLPSWPLSWLAHIRQQPVAHVPVLLWPLGAIGLVGLLRWRTAEGRALAAYTVVPVSIVPTDHLMLWLIPRTAREMVALTASSWLLLPVVLGFLPGAVPVSGSAIRWLSTVSLVLPCAIIVWRRRYDKSAD